MAGHVVKVSVTANTKKFSTAFRNLKNETGLTSLQNAATTAISTMAKVAAAASVAMAAASGKVISMAADLEQSTGAIEAVFKGAADQMKDFAANAATNVGLARNEYQQLATILGAQLKNGGTPLDQLSGKTNDLIKTAADLSAMFGGTTTDAVNALSSALKGERNPIERYGVSLTQAAVEAKAAALGFEKVDGALSSEANQAATLALIMEQTADAHGAFARENDTLAHQMQVIKAKLTDAATSMGEVLLPAATAVAKYLNEHLTPAIDYLKAWLTDQAIPAIKSFAKWLQAKLTPVIQEAARYFHTVLIPALKDLYAWLSDKLPPVISAVAAFLKEWYPTLIKVAAGVFLAVKAFQAFQKVKAILLAVKGAVTALNFALAANPIVIVIAALSALGAGLYALYQNSETFRNGVQTAWTAIKTTIQPVVNWVTSAVVPRLSKAWQSIKAAATALFQALSTLWQTVGKPLFNFILATVSGLAARWQGIWNGVKTVFSGVWNTIQSVVTSVIDIITGILNTFSALLNGDFTAAWEGIKTVVSGVWDFITGIIEGALDTISGIFETGWNTVTGILEGAWNGMKNAVSSAWEDIKSGISEGIDKAVSTVKDLPNKILEGLGDLGNLLWDAGKQVIQGFIDGVKSMWGKVKEAFSWLTSWIPEWKGPAEVDRVLLRDNGRLVIGGFIHGLQSRFGDVKKTLNGLTAMVGDTAFPGLSTPGAPISTARHGAAVINVYTLTPTLETGRAIAAALSEYERMNGGRR